MSIIYAISDSSVVAGLRVMHPSVAGGLAPRICPVGIPSVCVLCMQAAPEPAGHPSAVLCPSGVGRAGLACCRCRVYKLRSLSTIPVDRSIAPTLLSTLLQPVPRIPFTMDLPRLLLIVQGYEFAISRTPVFVRSLLAARSTALHVHVIGDQQGLRGFGEVWQSHAVGSGLAREDDETSFFSMDDEAVSEFLSRVHASCHARGYAYLFLKLLAAELLPGARRLIVLDPDTIVLGDIAELWREFDRFDESHVLSMAVDQSDRYYYRLQSATDEVYSPGWRGVPHGVGVNGGVLLLHAERARRRRFAQQLAALTHEGAAERAAGTLAAFCDLAEQDALNLAIAHEPQIWRPLDCVWNYMATRVGGHRLHVDEALALNFYDECPDGPRGAGGTAGGDLLRCSCGRRVELLHFAGGVRALPLLQKLNESIVAMSAHTLQELARFRKKSATSLEPAACDA